MRNDMDKAIEYEQNELLSQLKERRKELGYTQRDVAEKAGIPQSTLARLESGIISPRIDTLINVGLVIGLKLTFIDK